MNPDEKGGINNQLSDNTEANTQVPADTSEGGQSVISPQQSSANSETSTVVMQTKKDHSKVFYFFFGLTVLCFVSLTGFLIWYLQGRKMLGNSINQPSAVTNVPTIEQIQNNTDEVILQAESLTQNDTFGNITADIDNTNLSPIENDITTLDGLFKFNQQ